MARPKKDPVRTMEIAAAVRQYFADQGKKQLEIAAETGLDTSVVSPLLTGKRPFGYRTGKVFADTYGFSQEYLADGRGPMMGDADLGEGGVFFITPEYLPENFFADKDEYNAYLLSKLKASDIALASARKKIMDVVAENADYLSRLEEVQEANDTMAKRVNNLYRAYLAAYSSLSRKRPGFRTILGQRPSPEQSPNEDTNGHKAVLATAH